MKKHHTIEEKIDILKKIKDELKKGHSIRSTCVKFGISQHSYYTWIDQIKDQENRSKLN